MLLIDCDLRHPCVGRYLGCTNCRGLGLVGYCAARRPLEEVLRVDEPSGMVFVPATPRCSLPVELLGSENMRRLVRERRRNSAW